MLHGKEWHLDIFHHVVNAAFVVWRRGQLFYRPVKRAGAEAPFDIYVFTSLLTSKKRSNTYCTDTHQLNHLNSNLTRQNAH